MNKQQQEKRYNAVINAMEWIEIPADRGNEDNGRYCFKDNTPEELENIFFNSTSSTYRRTDDLSYEIFNSACNAIENIGLDDLLNEDKANDLINEINSASVYISERLLYLNNLNEDEIMDIIKNYSSPTISEACAIWYDEQVQETAQLLRDYIIGNSNE